MATPEYHFPLLLWEQSEEYREQLQHAQQEFGCAFAALYHSPKRPYGGEITFTSNAVPVVWLNLGHAVSSRRWSSKEALAHARENGTYGYFRAVDIKDFAKGKGFMVDEAMWDLGFRRSKVDPRKWAHRQKGEPDEDPYHAKWEILFGTDFQTPAPEGQQRLQSLLEMENAQTKLGHTYSLSVGRTGLIHVSLDANPFAGHSANTIGELGRQLAQKAHIAKVQEGFLIEAKNVRIFDDPVEEGCIPTHDAIHIQAIGADGQALEVVWPATTTSADGISLSVSLRTKMHDLLQPAMHTSSSAPV